MSCLVVNVEIKQTSLYLSYITTYSISSYSKLVKTNFLCNWLQKPVSLFLVRFAFPLLKKKKDI